MVPVLKLLLPIAVARYFPLADVACASMYRVWLSKRCQVVSALQQFGADTVHTRLPCGLQGLVLQLQELAQIGRLEVVFDKGFLDLSAKVSRA